MKLYASYDKTTDVFMLTSICPKCNSVTYISKQFSSKYGCWVAVRKNDIMNIYTRSEYLDIIADNNVCYDKIAYFINERDS